MRVVAIKKIQGSVQILRLNEDLGDSRLTSLRPVSPSATIVRLSFRSHKNNMIQNHVTRFQVSQCSTLIQRTRESPAYHRQF